MSSQMTKEQAIESAKASYKEFVSAYKFYEEEKGGMTIEERIQAMEDFSKTKAAIDKFVSTHGLAESDYKS